MHRARSAYPDYQHFLQGKPRTGGTIAGRGHYGPQDRAVIRGAFLA
jgi:hypothetical protein